MSSRRDFLKYSGTTAAAFYSRDLIANILATSPNSEVIVAGGILRRTDGALVGDVTAEFIGQLKVDYAIIGSAAVDPDGSLLDYDFREVRVAQAILSNARQVMLVCDSSKFERSAPVRIGHLSQVATFVTDRCESDGIRRICAESGVELIEALAQTEAVQSFT